MVGELGKAPRATAAPCISWGGLGPGALTADVSMVIVGLSGGTVIKVVRVWKGCRVTYARCLRPLGPGEGNGDGGLGSAIVMAYRGTYRVS